MTVPAAVLTALGRLNAHARVRGLWSNEREAIYIYKRLAALLLIQAQEAAAAPPSLGEGPARQSKNVRLVRMTAKCRGCTDGWWTDWDGERRHCRWCSGGHVVLRFTETSLPDGQVWHHPWEGQSSHGIELAQAARPGMRLSNEGVYVDAAGQPIAWEDPGDWSPLKPGVALALQELVTLLNEVEDWVEALPEVKRGTPWWWCVKDAKRCLHHVSQRGVLGPPSHRYRLDLGLLHMRCFVCGASDDLTAGVFGRLTALFHWSLKACRAHEGVVLDGGPVPSEMIFPELQRWIARHDRVVEEG